MGPQHRKQRHLCAGLGFTNSAYNLPETRNSRGHRKFRQLCAEIYDANDLCGQRQELSIVA